MHFWLVRILLNVAALIAGGLVAFAGMATTASLLPDGWSLLVSAGLGVLLYFFIAWSLAKEATSGLAQVGLVAYLAPLFLTYFVPTLLALFGLFAFVEAAMVNPEEPDIVGELWSVLFSLQALYALVGALVVAGGLLIPPVIAIVDQPPPADPSDATMADDVHSATVPETRVTTAPIEREQFQPVQVRSVVAEPRPTATEGETLEELFGLEPGRNG